MGRLLERAFAEAAKLPETEQEAIAALVLAELDSERKWDDLFAKSQDLLSKLAQEARDECRAGQTEPLDPDKL
jgi:predicted amidophosphoribosyltransferase